MSTPLLTRLRKGQENLDLVKKEIELGARLILDFVMINPDQIKWSPLSASVPTSVFVYRFENEEARFNMTWYTEVGKVLFQLHCAATEFGDESRFIVDRGSMGHIKMMHAPLRSTEAIFRGFEYFLEQFQNDHPDFRRAIGPLLSA